jgi:peptidyl-prolyl cis-trans isomerase B (cyclophilin B)
VASLPLVPKSLAALIALLVAFGIALSGCGGDDGSSGDGEETSAASDSPCESVELGEPQEFNLDPPPSKPSADDLTAVVDTSCGSFEITLATKESPKTTASFEYMAENGVYDGSPFQRIIPEFVIQGGDPAGTGMGPGPGYFVDEPPPDDAAYTEGVVAMAKTPVEPPGRSSSQFFVVTVPDTGLPPDYAIVGEVADGMDVVDAIEAMGNPDGSGEPLEPVVINSVTIEEG